MDSRFVYVFSIPRVAFLLSFPICITRISRTSCEVLHCAEKEVGNTRRGWWAKHTIMNVSTISSEIVA